MTDSAQEPPPDEMVPLLQVDTLSEAEVILSMLRGYGIHAHRNPHGRYEPHQISVAASQLQDAKDLLGSIISG